MTQDRQDAALAAAARYLEGLIDFEKKRTGMRQRISLAPIRALLDRLGAPERGMSVIHVAGSKGKGSTALFAEALLRATGASTGVFTSPHLERWSERFRIDGAEVAPERLAAVVDGMRPHVDALRDAGGETAPTFFDATTAAALLLFREAAVDHVVLEVGLGGRLDSTNAVTPAACCITSIELEHTDVLGDTLAEIAAEKAGILKPGVPAVCGALAPEALEVVERLAEEIGCSLSRLGREIEVTVQGGGLASTRVRIRDGGFALETELAVPGLHQAENAALALAAVRRLPGAGVDALREPFAAALAAARLPGRVEVLSREPLLIVDGAHTAASARALADVLARLSRPVDFVVSLSAGKDARRIFDALLPHARSLTLTRADPVRSLDPRDVATLASALRADLPLRVVPNPHLALRAAREALEPDAVLCATGSVYLAGIARRVLAEPSPVAVTRGRAP